MSNIGMMDGAFFVGRKEIIDWINQTLNLNLTKVEQTASGAIACQLLDAMHPGDLPIDPLISPHYTDQVPMHKVNWSAKQDFEFIQNYKILQTCFTKLNIDRVRLTSPLYFFS
jgi:microtubule-associated protein, RP/EB family